MQFRVGGGKDSPNGYLPHRAARSELLIPSVDFIVQGSLGIWWQTVSSLVTEIITAVLELKQILLWLRGRAKSFIRADCLSNLTASPEGVHGYYPKLHVCRRRPGESCPTSWVILDKLRAQLPSVWLRARNHRRGRGGGLPT